MAARLPADDVIRRVEALLGDAELRMSALQRAGKPPALGDVDDLRSRLEDATLTLDRLRETDADRRSWSRLESCAVRLARELRFLAAS